MSNQVEFTYRAIVFALKRPHTLDNYLPGKKLLAKRSVIIAEHAPDDNPCTEWDGLHYHGIVEHLSHQRFDIDRVFNEFKGAHCEWFKSEQCKVPLNYLAYIQMPPRRIVYSNFRDDQSDLPMLQASVTPELLLEVAERKNRKVNERREGSNDIMYLKDLILKTNCQSESELLNIYSNDAQFEKVFCKRTFSTNFRKALSFAIQYTLDTPIRDLCISYVDTKNECMQPSTSAELVEKWCSFQNIDPQQFVYDMIDCIDKKKRKLNTLILKGQPNSGKTFIAKSMEKACRFFGEITQGTGGYNFMWQDCVNKRLIVINEPYFDDCIIEQLKVVLEGTGTFVHKKNSSDEYLRPTPVLITTNNHVWATCYQSEQAIRARCLRIYDNLKPCPLLKRVKRDLHPQWLSILAIKYAPNASPVSDFSDDECLSTGPGIDTVDRVLIPDSQNSKEAPSTPSISAVKDTTQVLETPEHSKRKLTDDSSSVLNKKVSLETRLQQLFPQRSPSEESYPGSTNIFLGQLSPDPEKDLPLKKRIKKSLTFLDQNEFDPNEETKRHLDQDNKDYEIWNKWRQEEPLDLSRRGQQQE